VLKKLDTGGLFTCCDPEADGARVARSWAAEVLSPDDLRRGGGETEGAPPRRHVAAASRAARKPAAWWARSAATAGTG
jgi:hypothetical protein